MSIAFVKLPGLPSERIVALVEPVLRAHRVAGVELMWRSDRRGWVLELTVEHPESTMPGHGITVDLCSEISRDLSAALDVSDLIGPRYRLEVGSPGVERALYLLDDYRRFRGHELKIKLKAPFGLSAPSSDGHDSDGQSSDEQIGDDEVASFEQGPVASERTPWTGQRVLRGNLGGVDEQGRIVLETEQGTLSLELSSVESARLLFDWQAAVRGGGRPQSPASGGQRARGAKRSK